MIPARTGIDDTSPDAHRLLVEGHRRMSAARKLHRVADLTRTVQLLALGRIRARHPEADEHELRLRLASLWIDGDLMVKSFGWDPRAQGR